MVVNHKMIELEVMVAMRKLWVGVGFSNPQWVFEHFWRPGNGGGNIKSLVASRMNQL